MTKQVTAPRGMRDFLPAAKAKRERALAIIRGVYATHGFDEIEAPAIEDYARLHAGLGGDNEKLSFSVLKRGLNQADLERAVAADSAESLCDLGLRFDLTVPLARYYASNRAQLPSVFRAVHIGPVWRAERPQKGRYRQFVQADIDIIGEAGPLAEAELITATGHALVALGLDSCVIRVNDRRLLHDLLAYCGFPTAAAERVLITVDKLDKIGVAGVITELGEMGEGFAEPAARLAPLLQAVSAAAANGEITLDAEGVAAVLPADFVTAAKNDLLQLGQLLAPVLPEGVRVCFDPTLVRGMGYYTGTIFEIAHPGSGSSVGGGGRYDGMIGRFLGEEVPAVGFSIGFERIIDLVDLPADVAAEAVALIADRECEVADLIALKAQLVAAGKRAQLVWRQKNMKPLFARLTGDGFTAVANVAPGVCDATQLHYKPLTQQNNLD